MQMCPGRVTKLERSYRKNKITILSNTEEKNDILVQWWKAQGLELDWQGPQTRPPLSSCDTLGKCLILLTCML